MSAIIQEAVSYRGFSLIDILQPCVSFNPVNTHAWYKKRVRNLAETGYAADNIEEAMEIARQGEDEIPIGVIFKQEKISFTDRIERLASGPLISRPFDPETVNSEIFRI